VKPWHRVVKRPLISADSHIVEARTYGEPAASSLKDQAPVFPEAGGGRALQAHAGGWDPPRAGEEMAADGVSGEVLYPSCRMNLFGLQDAALQEASFGPTTTGS